MIYIVILKQTEKIEVCYAISKKDKYENIDSEVLNT